MHTAKSPITLVLNYARLPQHPHLRAKTILNELEFWDDQLNTMPDGFALKYNRAPTQAELDQVQAELHFLEQEYRSLAKLLGADDST